MSTWIGSITDAETARKAGGAAIMANTMLGLVTGDLYRDASGYVRIV